MNRNIPTLNALYMISHHTALSFGLDHHFPTKSNDVPIDVEFE